MINTQTISDGRRGFTLIELLLYMGLTSIFIVVFSQVLLAVIGLRLESRQTSDVQQDARFIVARLTRDIRRASDIQLPLLGQTQQSVVLTVPEESGDVVYSYALLGDELALVEGSASAVRLHSDTTRITGFSVQRAGNSGDIPNARDTLRIVLQVSGTDDVASIDQSIEMTTSIGLR